MESAENLRTLFLASVASPAEAITTVPRNVKQSDRLFPALIAAGSEENRAISVDDSRSRVLSNNFRDKLSFCCESSPWVDNEKRRKIIRAEISPVPSYAAQQVD